MFRALVNDAKSAAGAVVRNMLPAPRSQCLRRRLRFATAAMTFLLAEQIRISRGVLVVAGASPPAA